MAIERESIGLRTPRSRWPGSFGAVLAFFVVCVCVLYAPGVAPKITQKPSCRPALTLAIKETRGPRLGRLDQGAFPACVAYYTRRARAALLVFFVLVAPKRPSKCCFPCLVSCLLLVSACAQAFALCLLVSAFWCAVCSPSHRRVGEGFLSLSLLLLFCAPRVLSKSLGPGPPKAECSLGVWGRAPGLLNGLVFCAVGGLGGLAAYLAACRPSHGA